MIAFLQPLVPHYREGFFKRLRETVGIDVFVYENKESVANQGFKNGDYSSYLIKSLDARGVLFYSLLPLLSRQYTTLVLMWHKAHVSTWLLLLTKWLHGKRIVLWGHGISVKRYIREERSPDRFLKWMAFFSDGLIVYTQREKELWAAQLPEKRICSMNNTFSGVENVLNVPIPSVLQKRKMRSALNIAQEVIIITCCRFVSLYRRADLLAQTIQSVDPERYGFIIIGDGQYKPDLSRYPNVYHFGAVYDEYLKNTLFSAADIYFQPAWTGLSIVEAMAYGKPVFTFRRSNYVKQCVEYYYIENGFNGLIFDNVAELVQALNSVDLKKIESMGANAREYVSKNLTLAQMVEKVGMFLRG